MSNAFPFYTFASGVISPPLHNRGDSESYAAGLRQGKNWFITEHGGAHVRPSLEFCEYLKDWEKPIRLVPFAFNAASDNSYIVVFEDTTIKFIQDGQYIMETGVDIASLSNDTWALVTTSSPHGYSTGDWVKIVSSDPSYEDVVDLTFRVTWFSTTTFKLQTPDNRSFDTSSMGAFSGTAEVQRAYSIYNPYGYAELFDLRFDQFRDELVITHVDHSPRKLVRTSSTSWSLQGITFEGNTSTTSNLSLVSDATASAGAMYAATTIDGDGVESHVGEVAFIWNSVDITDTAGTVELSWDAVDGAAEYFVYRTNFYPKATYNTAGETLGYIGRTYGPNFADNNIIPDFTKTPPIPDNPFANEAVLSITVTNGGSGYAKGTTTVSITGGTGFEGLPIVDQDGTIIAVRILAPGRNYDGGTLTFSGAGTGATATFTTSPSLGNWPRTVARHEQRRWYAGTSNLPMTFYASRAGKPDDFTRNSAGGAVDPIEYNVDDPQIDPIKDLMGTDLGLFLFTEGSIWFLAPGQSGVLAAGEILATHRASTGIGDVSPIKIQDNVLYVESHSLAVNEFSPSSLRNYYERENRSLHAQHYFSANNPIVDWCYAHNPHRCVWLVRADGTLLSLTYIPEKQVFAWSNHTTRGKVKSVATITENGYDVVYAVVARKRTDVGGTTSELKYVERLMVGTVLNEEDLGSVDSAVVASLTAQSGTVTASAATGTSVTVTSQGTSPFSAGSVGDYLRFGNGVLKITGYTSGVSVTADVIYPITDLEPETNDVQIYDTWYLDTPVASVKGLWHLEGKTVQVFADGVIFDEATVSNGEIAFSWSLAGDPVASNYTIGLPYEAVLTTLPLPDPGISIQDKTKRTSDVSARVINTRGLEAGSFNSGLFYEMTDEVWEDHVIEKDALSIVKELEIAAEWTQDDGVTFKKTGPRLAYVVGLVSNTEVGND